MALIKEFKAVRFTENAGKIEEIVCPPYDIISPAEKEAYLNANENNIIKLESPEQTEAGYLGARAELEKRFKNGIMAEDKNPALYIY